CSLKKFSGVDLKLSQKALLLVAVPLCFEIVFVVTLYGLLLKSERETAAEAHWKSLLSEGELLTKDYLEGGQALFNYALTKDKASRAWFEHLRSEIGLTLARLNQLEHNQARLERIKSNAAAVMERFNQIEEITDGGAKNFPFIKTTEVIAEMKPLFHE